MKAITAGDAFGCALSEDGTVACWGNANAGRLALPPDDKAQCEPNNTCRPTPTLVPSLTGAVQLSGGLAHACARFADGEVRCWGYNGTGFLGHGTDQPEVREAPGKVPLPGPALEIAAGAEGDCARVTENGNAEVYCWGKADMGITGAPLAVGVRGPTKIPGLTGAKQISTSFGYGIACAVRADDTVACWGRSMFGALGHTPNSKGDVACGLYYCTPTPSQVGDATFKVFEVQTGSATACARTMTGGVACWGLHSLGGLGTGAPFDVNDHPTPADVPALAGTTSLSLRYTNACAVVGGEVLCWGENTWGSVGDGLGGTTCLNGARCNTAPVKLAGLAGIKQVAVGVHFSVALDADDLGWGWGANPDARTGHAPGSANDIATCGLGTTHCTPRPQSFSF